MYIFILCLLHFLIVKFILIYLLHMLFVFKIETFLERKIQSKELKRFVFFIYSIDFIRIFYKNYEY